MEKTELTRESKIILLDILRRGFITQDDISQLAKTAKMEADTLQIEVIEKPWQIDHPNEMDLSRLSDSELETFENLLDKVYRS